MATGPLYAVVPGQLGYQSVYLPTGQEILARQNPLVIMASLATGGVAPYLGNTNNKQKPVSLKMMVVPSPEFQFYEFDPERTRTTTLSANINTTTTTIPISSADGFNIKDEIHLPSTGEIMRVTAVGANVLTVERAFSSTLASNTVFPSSLTQDSASSATSGASVVRLGPAMEEGSFAIYRDRKQATRRIGHTQILRTDVIQTGTEQAQEPSITIAEERFEKIKLQELAELYLDHEYIGWFGKLHRASRDGEVIRTTQGMLNFISTNNVAASALQGGGSQITVDKLEDMIYRANKRGGKKTFLVGNEGFRYIAKLVRETSTINEYSSANDNKFGFSPDMIFGVFGQADFVYYPLMDLAPLNKQIVAIDPDQLMLCTLRDRALKWTDNTQQNDYDGRAGRWLTEFGVVPLNEKQHHRFTGFTFFA